MPVPTATMNQKNLWIAAGDGDLERVRVSHFIGDSSLASQIDVLRT